MPKTKNLESMTGSPGDYHKSVRIESTTLVSVSKYGKNPFKKRSIIISNQKHQVNSRFIENSKELREERLALLFLSREDFNGN